MKLFTVALISSSILLLFNGSCEQKKILKQELSAQQYKQLKASPDCLKEQLITHYEEKGSLEDVDLIRSTVNGEEVYYLGGVGMYQIMNQSCEDIGKTIRGSADFENIEPILGTATRVPPPPAKVSEPIIMEPKHPSTIGEKPGGELNPLPPKRSKDDGIQMEPKEPSTVGQKPRAELDPPPGRPSKGKPVQLSDYDINTIEKIKASEFPECLQGKMEYFIKDGMKLSMAQCYSYISNGQTYYMFDHGMAVDGPGFILNENCDTVCVTGGMRRGNPDMKPCPKEEDYKARKEIWLQGNER